MKNIITDIIDNKKFNNLTEAELLDFTVEFNKQNIDNQIEFLIFIIKNSDIKDIVIGNFKKFFNDNYIKELLLKICDM